MHHPRQNLRHLRCVRVFEVDDSHITGLLEGRIQIGNQLAYSIDSQFVSGHHDTVRALVGDQHRLFVRLSALTLTGFFEGVEHADHILCHAILQANNFGGLNGRAVHTLDNVDNTPDVGTYVGDDDGIARRIGRHVCLLGYERPQDRNELGRRDIIEADNLRHVLVISHCALTVHNRDGRRSRVLAGDDPDDLTASNCGVPLNIEYRKEQIVEFRLRHGLG